MLFVFDVKGGLLNTQEKMDDRAICCVNAAARWINIRTTIPVPTTRIWRLFMVIGVSHVDSLGGERGCFGGGRDCHQLVSTITTVQY